MPRKSKTGKRGRKYSRVRTKTRKNKSRRYRGGCEKCNQPAGESLWSSSGPIRGGTINPEQMNQDIYNHKTDSSFYSSS
jgi:hypothetical protein